MKIEITQMNVGVSHNRKGEPFRDRHKIYIFHDKESIEENLISRRNRPYDDYKEFVIPKVMEMLDFKFQSHYRSVMNEKWRFRQNCGCSSCPCSPGFIGNNKVSNPLDIFVTVKF